MINQYESISGTSINKSTSNYYLYLFDNYYGIDIKYRLKEKNDINYDYDKKYFNLIKLKMDKDKEFKKLNDKLNEHNEKLSLLEQIAKSIDKNLDEIKRELKDTRKEFKEDIEKVKEELKETRKEFKKDTEKVKEELRGTREEFKEGIEKVKEELKETREEFKEGIDKVKEELKETTYKVVSLESKVKIILTLLSAVAASIGAFIARYILKLLGIF